jgi:predicted Rdx family selenoprotein
LTDFILQNFHDKVPGGVLVVPSEGGIFEIQLGETMIFSNRQTYLPPNEEQIRTLIKQVLS